MAKVTVILQPESPGKPLVHEGIDQDLVENIGVIREGEKFFRYDRCRLPSTKPGGAPPELYFSQTNAADLSSLIGKKSKGKTPTPDSLETRQKEGARILAEKKPLDQIASRAGRCVCGLPASGELRAPGELSLVHEEAGSSRVYLRPWGSEHPSQAEVSCREV